MSTIRIPTIAMSSTSGAATKKPQRPVQYPYVAELINMRSAMGGFAAGAYDQLTTGRDIFDQVHDPACVLAATGLVGLTALGTSFTVDNRLSGDSDEWGPFTPRAETLNGRLAMGGILGLMTIAGVSQNLL